MDEFSLVRDEIFFTLYGAYIMFMLIFSTRIYITITIYPVKSHQVGSGMVEGMQSLPLPLRDREVVSERPLAQANQSSHKTKKGIGEKHNNQKQSSVAHICNKL